MPKYSRSVNVPGKGAQEIYEVVARDIDRFLGKIPIGEFELERDPIKKEVRFKAAMASATLTFEDGALHLNGQLSLMVMPFKSKLDEGLERWVKKIFPIEPPAA